MKAYILPPLHRMKTLTIHGNPSHKGFTVTGPYSAVSVFMVTGGKGYAGAGKSVELLSMNGTRLCSLPDLPGERWFHSQNGLVTCGGGKSSSVRKSCLTFSGGRWKRTHTLGQIRLGHTGWASPRGLLLIGGRYSDSMTGRTTTELLTENGETTPSFNLKYRRS